MDNPHVDALSTKHEALGARINAEEHRPHPDMELIQKLKREKLRLKDEIVGH